MPTPTMAKPVAGEREGVAMKAQVWAPQLVVGVRVDSVACVTALLQTRDLKNLKDFGNGFIQFQHRPRL